MAYDNSDHASSSTWPPLQPGETLRWEGRPAPRCYTFRKWRDALLGAALTLLCAVWFLMRLAVPAGTAATWLTWLPLPFLVYALWLAAGQQLAARLEWPRVAYAVTDRRILVRRGRWRVRIEEMPLARLSWFRLQPHGEELGSLQLRGGAGDPLLQIECVEYPRRPAELLEEAIKHKADFNAETRRH